MRDTVKACPGVEVRMLEIRGPDPHADIWDRQLDCEFSLEPCFLALIDAARSAGWQPLEAALALTSLADNFVIGQAENTHTDWQIQEAQGRRAG